MSKSHTEKQILDDFYSIYWRAPTLKEFLIIWDHNYNTMVKKHGSYKKLLNKFGYDSNSRGCAITYIVKSNSVKNEILFIGNCVDIAAELSIPARYVRRYAEKNFVLYGKYRISVFPFENIYDENGKLKKYLRKV